MYNDGKPANISYHNYSSSLFAQNPEKPPLLLLLDGLPVFPDSSTQNLLLQTLLNFSLSFERYNSNSIKPSGIGIVLIIPTLTSFSSDLFISKLVQIRDRVTVIKFCFVSL